jgi:FAD-dependent urate hydroxylase
MASAVVVGGGLGGLAAALALEQSGHDVAVYEQAEEARREGGSITLWSNGTAALAALGVVPSSAQVIRRMLLRDGTGRELLDLDLTAVADQHGYPCVNTWRRDLLTDLTRAMRGSVHFGRRCVGVEHGAMSARVQFADGTRVEGDIVVIADGVHSAVRGAVWGGRSSYAGTTCWEGRLSACPSDLPADIAVAIATTSTYAMAFAMPGGTAHWFVDTREPRPESSQLDRPAVDAIARDWPQPFPAVIAATGADDLHRTPIYVRRPPRRWFKGRVVLLGDSAHAMGPALGQGGTQAFVDAVALGTAMAECASVEGALRQYQRQRARAVMSLWIGSNLTLRMRRTGLLELATRHTPRSVARGTFARSVTPDRVVRRALTT